VFLKAKFRIVQEILEADFN